MAPNGARRLSVPTNPVLADFLGDMDFDFENSIVIFGIFWIPIFKIYRSPKIAFTGGLPPPRPLLFLGASSPRDPLVGGLQPPRGEFLILCDFHLR